MISRRTLSRLAVLGCLGMSFLLAPGRERVAQATSCPQGRPACTTQAFCQTYCQQVTGSPAGAVCYLNCCLCPY
jgi:hypothetical protein